MEKNAKKIYKVIIIILIIIILLLSLYVFTKFGKINELASPNTTIDIFELLCNPKDDTCDCTVNNNTNPNNINSNNSTNNNTNTNDNNEEADNNDTTTPNDFDEVQVVSETKTWNQVSQLRIFENSTFVDDIKIAPGVSSTYYFIVRNSSSLNVTYNLEMIETNEGTVNMKYRLKKNGMYVSGNDSYWVNYSALNFTNLLLDSTNEDEYILEWKWFDSENDTTNGIKTPSYKLEINIQASSI